MARFLCPTCGESIAPPTYAAGKPINCGSCGETIQYALPVAKAVPYKPAGKSVVKKQDPPWLWIIAGSAVGGLMMILLLLSWSNTKEERQRRENEQKLAAAFEILGKTPAFGVEPKPKDDGYTTKLGEMYEVTAEEGYFYVADTDEAYDAFNKALSARDRRGLGELLFAQRVMKIENRTRVRILGNRIFSVEVRVIDGPFADRKGIVNRELVKFKQ